MVLLNFMLVCFLIWIMQLLVCGLLRIRHVSTDRNKLHSKEKSNQSKNKYIGGKVALIGFLNGLEKWTIYQVGKIPSHMIRKAIYIHVFGMGIENNVVIYHGTIFRRPSNIKIGEGSIIGDRCELDGRGGLIIGKNCNLSSEVHIWTAQHDLQASQFDYTKEVVEIGDRSWISSNTIILPGVKIGEGTVLAAGAVLTHNTEAFSIYAGVPAKRIGDRNSQLEYEFDGSRDWFI